MNCVDIIYVTKYKQYTGIFILMKTNIFIIKLS